MQWTIHFNPFEILYLQIRAHPPKSTYPLLLVQFPVKGQSFKDSLKCCAYLNVINFVAHFTKSYYKVALRRWM